MSASVVRVPGSVETDKTETKREPSPIDGELLKSVRVSLEVRLGEAPMTVDEVLALKAGAVVTLDAGLADPIELYLNDTLVARGEIVAVGDKYGIRIVEIAPVS
jgi:flagellar motor switch protein FliN/FliY